MSSRRIAVLLALFLPVSLFAAGHDISATRTAPASNSFATGLPAIAFNGSRFLTIWPMSGNVYGALSDPDRGTKTDAFPILLFANADQLQLIAAGGGYLTAWNEGEVPFITTLTSEGVVARHVRLDSPKLVAPRVAFNGQRIIVVDRTAFNVLHKATTVSIYDLDGTLVRRFSLPVSGVGSYAVTDAGDDFAIVTSRASFYIDEWRVSNDGTILSTVPLPPAPRLAATTDVSIASNDNGIAVAWVDLETATVSAAVIAPNGTVTSLAVPSGGVPANRGISVLPVETGFAVAWNVLPSRPDNPAVFAVRIGENGGILDEQPAHLGDGIFSAASSSGDAIELALITPTLAAATLTASVDTGGFSPRAATPASVMPVQQFAPALASNGAGFTAAWMEQSAGPHGVMTGRVSRDGDPLDGTGTDLDDDAANSVTIVHGSSESLAAWSNSTGVFVARVSPFGTPLDQTPITISINGSRSVAAAWNGSRYFVVWPDSAQQLVGALIGPDGTATTPKVILKSPSFDSYVFAPDVAWDGQHYIVVFAATVYDGGFIEGTGPSPDNVRVMRVSASGDAIDAVPVQIPGMHVRAHVASSGDGALIALDSDSDVSTMAVHDEDGALKLDAEVPLFHWFGPVSSDVAWDGSAYTVGWNYRETVVGPGWLGAARMSQSGSPFERWFTSTGPNGGPSIATNSLGETALAISETDPASYVSRARLYFNTEMSPAQAPPAAPRNAISYFGNTTRIDWQSGGPADGFLIERSSDFGQSWSAVTVTTAGVQTLTTPFAAIGDQFRISAFGPGGLSAGTITSVASPRRHRVAGRR